MIKANELRIGNLLENMGDIIKVEYLDKSLVKGVYHRVDTYNTSIQLKQCNPILLTEELCLKFNFQKDLENTIYKDINKYCFFCYDSNTVLLYDNENNYCLRKIKYVHELQNLFFALTGEELSLNVGIQSKNDE